MLQLRTRHRSMTCTGWALAVSAAVVIGQPLAALTTAAATITAQSGTVSGRIVDASGGVVPGATVTLTDATGAASRTVTNAPGRFTFGDLRAGSYELTVTLPGFKAAHASLAVMDGQTVEPLLTLEVGALKEDITVACSTPTVWQTLRKLVTGLVPRLYAEAGQTPIRVGGNVRPPRRTHYVAPVCPSGIGAPALTIVLSGAIDVSGRVVSVALAPGVQAPPEAVDAAVEAIRQWEYTPTLLNGRAIAVEIAVTIRFVER